MIKEIGYLIGLVGLLQACEVETSRNGWIEKLPPRAVLNAMLNPDSAVRVNISRTANGMYDHWSEYDYIKALFINDAEVELLVNGVSKGPMSLEESGNGFYRLPGVSVVAGDRVALRVNTPEYGNLSSETWIPSPVGEISIDTISHSPTGLPGSYYTYMKLRLSLQDQAGQPNYYMVSFEPSMLYQKEDTVIRLDTVQYGASFWGTINATLESKVKKAPDNYIYFLSGSYGSYHSNDDFLFTDEGRDGKNMTLDFTLENLLYSYQDDSVTCTHTCQIIISAISESYYLYRYSIALQKEQNDILGDLGLREPIPTYSNVKGGYGILSARQLKKYDIVLPYLSDYPWHEYYWNR